MNSKTVLRIILAGCSLFFLVFLPMPQLSLLPAKAQETVTVSETTYIYLPLVLHSSVDKYLGVAIPLASLSVWPDNVSTFVAVTQKRHGVYLIGAGFGCAWADTVGDIQGHLDYIHSIGGVPFITWMPKDCSNNGFGDIGKIGLANILSGEWDSYIKQWATDVSALGYPVFVRWGHEMNIPTYPWAGQHAFGRDGKTDYNNTSGLAAQGCSLTNCYGDPALPDGPERYIDAYRRVHDLVASRASNIIWVWCPNDRNWPLASAASWNSYEYYYPGAAYVDWIGVDGYNWGDQSGNGYGMWISFDGLFSQVLADMSTRYPGKPQMIAELASVEDDHDPNRKANWIRDAYRSAENNYPSLRVISWENEIFWDAFKNYPRGGNADFRVDSSLQALQAYREAVAGWSNAPVFR